MFDDSRSRFPTPDEAPCADPRIASLELHPTGPLWGNGSPDAAGEAAAVERAAVKSLSELTSGLEAAGLKADRRALRLRVDEPLGLAAELRSLRVDELPGGQPG